MKGASAIGTHRHLVTCQGPGTPVADGDGGYTTGWSNLVPPTWRCSIEPATERDLERVAAGTVISTASHVLKGLYHPQLAVSSRLIFGTRVFQVTGVSDPEERHLRSHVLGIELIDAAPVVDDSWMEDGWAE